MKNVVGIRTAGKMAGLSERTLRYWESLGLILPSRTPSGHRKYTKTNIKRIIQLKDTLKKNALRVNDLLTSSAFMLDEELKGKVRDPSQFEVKEPGEPFYADAKKNMRLQPVSGLPDNFFMQQEIERRLEDGEKIAVIYADLEDLHPYNQRYSYARGDRLLRFVALLLFDKLRELGNTTDFAGHLGADDFVLLTSPDRYRGVCAEVIRSFDRLIPLYYDQTDRENGGLTLKNRKGEETAYPVMSITLSVITNEQRELGHFVQISDLAHELKRHATTFKRSEMVVDRRVA